MASRPLPAVTIRVTATTHPTRDAWVDARAAEVAATGGLTLGAYLGREAILGPRRDPGLCCHLYAATKDGSGT